jgi:hypothetical protein
VFVQVIAASSPDAQGITLVMDNLNTNTPGSLYGAFVPGQAKALRGRFEFVYTPNHGSWLNIAEIEINVMAGQCMDLSIDSIEAVRSEVAAWHARRDNLQAKDNWQFTTKDACVELKRLYPTTLSRSDTGPNQLFVSQAAHTQQVKRYRNDIQNKST